MANKVWINNSIEDLNKAAAAYIADILSKAVRLRGAANLALSGGSTPMGLYQTLSQDYYRELIPWNKIHFFWGDERCVPPDHPESNYKQALDHLLGHIPAILENIHRIKGELSPDEAVSDYIQVLSGFAQGKYPWPVFDVALMGMGEDGHTASLFPGTVEPLETVTLVIQVNTAYQDRPSRRITLTAAVFNSSRNVIFLVTGEKKAKTLEIALSDRRDPVNIPVQRIKPTHGNTIWYVDSEAAKFLKER